MDIRHTCPYCKQHVVVDEAGGGMEIECPGCHNRLTIPATAQGPARKLPGLRHEEPAEASSPSASSTDALSPVPAKSGGRGATYRCNNPGCGAVLSESQLRTQQVAGRMSRVCPKCRMNVTMIAARKGFWSRFGSKK
jgi:uncharacterized protein YbaR (Trm112 family)